MPALRDARYALRLLARTPGSTLLTILVLAGGLGISTFAFSFLHTAMIRPLPLAEGDRIVRLMTIEEGRRRQIDEADLAELRAMRTLRDMAAYMRRDVLIGREGQTRALTVAAVDPSLFAIARTPAAQGRTLVPGDALPGAEPVIVLSHRAWRVAFGQSGAILDRTVPINGVETRVAGIMPDRFGFPVAEDAWMPLPAAATVTPGTSFVSVAARLAPGATPDEAAAEATAILRRSMTARAKPGERAPTAAALVDSFPSAQFGEERTLLFGVLNGIALLILLLSVVNAATLLTARANERIRETAVRMALGASSARIVVQGMWEGTLLCLAGGLLGTAGAAWALGAITRWTRANIEENLAFWWVWEADRTTVLGGAAFVVVAIAALGALVSVRAARVNVREVMQDGTLGAGSRRSGRLARGLVVTQVATVTVLMFVGVLSGVMGQRVLTLDPGYDPAGLLQVGLAPATVPRFAAPEARDRLFADVQARLAGDGAIDGALLRATLATRESGRFAIQGPDPASAQPGAYVLGTLGDLAVLEVRPIAGRLFTTGDGRSQAAVALVSQSLAARHWPGRSPVGESLRLGSSGDRAPLRTIVGVVSDVPYGNPFSRDRSTDAIYVPLAQSSAEEAAIYVRSRTAEGAAREALYQVLSAADPALTPRAVHRTAEVLRKAGFLTIALAKLFGACFAFALLLAVAGTYGLMSTAIGQRTREIGVRRALGASDAVATRLLLMQGARQLGIGTLIAAPIVAAIGIAAARLLPLGSGLTAAAGVLVSAAIVAVVLAATWVPIRKALRTPLRTALLRES
jgi:predicted permease